MATDIFKTNVDLLLCLSNCKGVMGAGLAYQFKIKYLLMFDAYKEACAEGYIRPGQVWFDFRNRPYICCFPTKLHWKSPSKLEYIDSGMYDFVDKLNVFKSLVKTVAIPRLGCGLGGLEWEHVDAIIQKHLLNLDEHFEVILC